MSGYAEWKAKIVIDPNIMCGEPTFPNSRLTVRHIGEMLLRACEDDESESVEQEILEDYPYLTDQDIMFSRLYVFDLKKRKVT